MFDLYRPILAAALIMAHTLGMTAFASAQQVVAFVNGEPITALDVEHRSRFVQISTNKAPLRQDIIDELINEKLKIHEAKKFSLEIPDSEVDSSFSTMASRMGYTPAQLTQSMAGNGTSAATLKSRIKADIAWNQLVRGRFRSTLEIRDRDVDRALEARKVDEKETVGYEYILRQIVVVIPRGSSESVIESKRREAEALRTRFQNCEDGIRFARALKDVAVRDQLTRYSADLPAALREILDNTPVGRLTAPEVRGQNVEMFALCAKKEAGDTPGKRRVRQEMFAERFDAQAKRYLQEIRRAAMIEYR